ncbi:MAG TPA: hypothetical protein PL143_10440 [Rhodocyclaceae bacterium]|nr:hypothetical protein [Rhodocyclaceae bacterium]
MERAKYEAAVRIALYSHDTMGLGHVRRNLLIAQALVGSALEASILVIAGIHEAGAFRMPRCVDCLTLPAYHKDRNGDYLPRTLRVELAALVSLRSQVIGAALQHFTPDLFIVDNVPRGALQELAPVLEHLRACGDSRCVLGLRDVLDEPDRLRQQWRLLDNENAIRDYYDAVWVYGDPMLYDAATEYAFSPDIAAKTTFTGYLDPTVRLRAAGTGAGLPDALPEELRRNGFTLCVIGGGQDGMAVTQAFARARLPPGEYGVIVTGPFLPLPYKRQLRDLIADQPRFRLVEFLPDPLRLMACATRVIAMGGYNTVLEILCLGKRALIVPRNRPRLEQTIRAQRLQALGLLDCIGFDELSPAALSAWLNADAPVSPPALRQTVDCGGLKRIPALAAALLSDSQRVRDCAGLPRAMPGWPGREGDHAVV